MHTSSMLRMKWLEDTYASTLAGDRIRVLDVGSYDVNGSYRRIFVDKKYEYLGLDMQDGPNVDIVLKNPYDWSQIDTDTFDLVISGQAFEHIEFFWVTLAEMARVLKQNGLLFVIAPHGFDEHRFPVDCYRFFSDGMVALARYVSLEPLHTHTNAAPNAGCTDWYSQTEADSVLVARKTYGGQTRYVDLSTYTCVPADHEQLRTGLIPYARPKVTTTPSPASRLKALVRRIGT